MRRLAGALALPVLLAGCGGQQPPVAPGRSAADAAACARHADDAELLRREAGTYAAMPVPPVRVALALSGVWGFYDDPGAVGPDLRRAMAEVATAIAELDAQGQAEVAPGGTLMDPVRLDPARTLAAVAAVDRACGG